LGKVPAKQEAESLLSTKQGKARKNEQKHIRGFFLKVMWSKTDKGGFSPRGEQNIGFWILALCFAERFFKGGFSPLYHSSKQYHNPHTNTHTSYLCHHTEYK
jgi:hypothetical protein